MKPSVLLLVLSVGFSVSVHAQSNAENEVRQVMSSFLTSFNNLDWESFRRLWAERPVMFHPFTNSTYAGDRIDDPTRFDEAWRVVFDGIRSSAAKAGVTQPPYQNLQPRDLRIDFPGPKVAVVTFHLGTVGGNIGRRMFVLAQDGASWRITHLHASNLAVKPPA